MSSEPTVVKCDGCGDTSIDVFSGWWRHVKFPQEAKEKVRLYDFCLKCQCDIYSRLFEEKWKSINTAPKDGTPIVCWRPGWENPCFLCWKTNPRIVLSHEEECNPELSESYFGDLAECDDYEFASLEGCPTYWHPLSKVPVSIHQNQPLKENLNETSQGSIADVGGAGDAQYTQLCKADANRGGTRSND